MELRDIVEQARTGDASAFNRLVDAYRDMALGYARTLVKDHHTAEDVVQESLVVAHAGLDRLLDSEAFLSWLRGIVRRRCLKELPRSGTTGWSEFDEVAEPGEFADEVLNRIGNQLLSDAIGRLPLDQRSILSLHYEEGLSHAQIGEALGITKATVNMRLHAARARLKRRLINMNEDKPTAVAIGRVESVAGPLVTLSFDPKAMPQFFSRLIAGQESLCVVRKLSDGLIQAVASRTGSIWTPGQEVRDSGDPFLESLGDQAALDSTPPFARDGDRLATGIKTVDVFAPLIQSGTCGVFAEWGVGALVLIPELVRRLGRAANRQSIFVFIPPMHDERQWRDANAEIEQGSRALEVYYLPIADPISSGFVDQVRGCNSKLILSRTLAEQGIYPSIDPVRSSSTARDDGVRQVADGVRNLVRSYFELQFPASSEATRTLSQDEWLTVRRGRLATRFLSQPFFVAEPYTGQPGVDADVEAAIETFAKILSGEYDAKNRDAFTMTGDTPRA